MKTRKLLFYAVLIFAVNCIGCTQAVDNKISENSKNRVIAIGNAELAVVLGANPSPAEKRVTELFAECIKDRTGISLAKSPSKAAFRLVIGTVESNDKIKDLAATRKDINSLGSDAYHITMDINKHQLYVIGQSDSGVVAGVGRLLREIKYGKGMLEVPALQISETPQMPNRGMYLWARKHFFAKPDQVDRYIEELALWGCNGLCFWFEMGKFHSFDVPEAQRWLEMYRRFYETARRMGMKTGLLMVANDAYLSSPQDLRISPIIGCPDNYLCPSKPGSVEQLIAGHEQVFKALSPIDIYNLFPADAGGCSCSDCTPWPTRGFWRIVKPLGDRIHEISPKTEIWLDTWHLNHPTFGGKDWQNLVANLDWSKERPEWFAGFEVGLAPKHIFNRLSAKDRKYYNEARVPLMVFPDISMWANHPGMLVNREYWKSLQVELNDYSPELMKGGWPYSERWNTDIASVMFLSWFWNSKKGVDTMLDEYASFYFGPEAKTARQLLDLLDDSCKDPNRKQKIQETLGKLDASVPKWVKRDWRWHEIKASASRFGLPRNRHGLAKPTSIANNTDWLDLQGRPILAHDGHITRVKDTFYWYGSSYAGNPKGKYGTKAGFAVWNGIQVYSSQDLINWKYRGVALPRPEKGWGVVGSVGRAHVIYNEKTRKYVMWYWYHTHYPTVFTMVATSDSPVGPFKVMGAREVGSQTGFGSDLNVFKDDDGKAYLVYTDHHRYDKTKRFGKGRGQYAILVDSLTDDYLDSNKDGAVAIPSGGEAPAMIRYRGKYIIAGSGVQGWNPTETRYVVADSPLGPYSKPGIMSKQRTWGGQITSFLYIKETDTLMAMCDQWWTPDKTDLNKSRYLWLPVYLDSQTGTAKMKYYEKWNPLEPFSEE